MGQCRVGGSEPLHSSSSPRRTREGPEVDVVFKQSVLHQAAV